MINQFEFLPSESEITPLAQMGYGETGDDMSEFNDEPAPCDEAACDNRDVPFNDDGLSDVEADAMTLASAGYGTDEDYGYFGDNDEGFCGDE